MKEFTVLLCEVDEPANVFTFFAVAESADDAYSAAALDLFKTETMDDPDGYCPEFDVEQYRPIAVFAGHLQDLYTQHG